MTDKESLIADTLHDSIMLSEFEKDVMATTLFNRLHDVYQNSTAYLTFPANRTKRMEHSLGCMYLCGEMFYASICNLSGSESDKEVKEIFFKTASEEIKAILENISGNREYGYNYSKKLGECISDLEEQYEELNIEGGIYNYHMPANIQKAQNKKVFAILFEGIRVAGLLHDIGHPPFSHISENALRYLYSEIKGKEESERNESENEFLNVLEGKVGGNHQLHEEMGSKISEILLLDVIKDIDEEEAKDTEIYKKQVYAILIREVALSILEEKTLFFIDLHKLIDGTLDGDRLDYVSRDPKNSGFKSGETEYDRLIYKLKLCTHENHFLFCPSASVVKTVEDFLMKRWNLYKNIIFHHRVIKTDFLLQNIIIKASEDYFAQVQESEKKRSYILPYDISGLWKANKALPSDKESAYALSQWNDAWLLTILKKLYFEKYMKTSGYLHDQLEEFLTNKKNYFSLIKRKEEFQEIDFIVSKVIAERSNEIIEKMTQLREHNGNQTDKKEESGAYVNIEIYLKTIEKVLEVAVENAEHGYTTSQGFTLCIAKRRVFAFNVNSFSDILENMMSVLGFEQGELFYAEKEPGTGTNKTLYFYQRNANGKEEIVPLGQISNISNVLTEDLKYSPFFFIYINKRSDKAREDIHILRSEIAVAIGNAIVEFVEQKIDSFFIDKEL